MIHSLKLKIQTNKQTTYQIPFRCCYSSHCYSGDMQLCIYTTTCFSKPLSNHHEQPIPTASQFHQVEKKNGIVLNIFWPVAVCRLCLTYYLKVLTFWPSSNTFSDVWLITATSYLKQLTSLQLFKWPIQNSGLSQNFRTLCQNFNSNFWLMCFFIQTSDWILEFPEFLIFLEERTVIG